MIGFLQGFCSFYSTLKNAVSHKNKFFNCCIECLGCLIDHSLILQSDDCASGFNCCSKLIPRDDGVFYFVKACYLCYCVEKRLVAHKNEYAAIFNKRVRLVEIFNSRRYLFLACFDEKLLCLLYDQRQLIERNRCIVIVTNHHLACLLDRLLKLGNVHKRLGRFLKVFDRCIYFILCCRILCRNRHIVSYVKCVFRCLGIDIVLCLKFVCLSNFIKKIGDIHECVDHRRKLACSIINYALLLFIARPFKLCLCHCDSIFERLDRNA